jgi:hypothetical protein
MGTLAKQFFDRAEQLGGLRAKIRLATLSRITSTEAMTVDDSPEVMGQLERGMNSVAKEFQRSGHVPDVAPIAARSQDPTVQLLRRHVNTYLSLLTQRSLFLGDVDTTFRRITEAAAVDIDVERVSVWLVDSKVTKIVCADLFERSPATHSSGIELSAKDFAPYFQALREEKTIAAHDAHTDPRTSCFSAGYLTPLGINSMLDVPIWVNQEMAGVVCHEHVGPKRVWTSDEEQFAYFMANFAALAMEHRT